MGAVRQRRPEGLNDEDAIPPVIHALRKKEGVGEMHIDDFIAFRYKDTVVVVVDVDGTYPGVKADIHLLEGGWKSLHLIAEDLKSRRRATPMSKEFYLPSVRLAAEFRHIQSRAFSSCCCEGWDLDLASLIVGQAQMYLDHLPVNA